MPELRIPTLDGDDKLPAGFLPDTTASKAYVDAAVDDLSGVTNAAAGRAALGLGGAAVLNVGASTGTVTAGDDKRISYVFDASTVNGTASNRTAIQAYLDAAEAVGGRVFLPRPPLGLAYRLDGPLYLPSGVELQMARDATIKALPAAGYLLQTKAMRTIRFAPRALTGTPSTTGGTLAAGTYYYKVTAVTAQGETMTSFQASATTTGATGSVALSWAAPNAGGPDAGAITGYRLYRGTVSGAQNVLIGSPTGTSFTDTGGAGTAATMPTSNGTINGRTVRASIIGGVWDSDYLNNDGTGNWVEGNFVGHCFDLQKVDELLIRDVKVRNARKWAIAVADFTNLRTENIDFDTFSDGIHVLGPGDGWRATDLRGTVGDDFVGISTVEWPSYAVSEGSVRNVSVEGITSTSGPSAVRMLGGSGTILDRIVIRRIRGVYGYFGDNTTIAAGIVFCNAEQQNPGRNLTTLGSLTVEDVQPSSHVPNVVQVDCTANVVNLRDIHAVTAGKRGFTTGAETVIKDLTIDGVVIHDPTITGVYLNGGGVRNTIEKATVRRVAYRHTSGSPTGFPIYCGNTTVRRLIVDGVEMESPSAGNNVIYCVNPVLDWVSVSNVWSKTADTVLYGNVGTFGVMEFANITIANGQAVVKLKNAAEVHLRGITANTLSQALVSLFGVNATPVVVSASGLTLTSAAGVAKDGSQVLRSRSFELACDVSKLTLTAGDMAYNTNAALACGVGPVVCNGTTWKHLHTDLTYP